MSWTYRQRTGELLDNRETVMATGYAGAGSGKNNPSLQCVADIGPLPRGLYLIAAPVDTLTHGPYVLWLTPAETNAMCGRSGFGMHGDSVVNPGSASEGCIVMARAVRATVWESGDRALVVVAS